MQSETNKQASKSKAVFLLVCVISSPEEGRPQQVQLALPGAPQGLFDGPTLACGFNQQTSRDELGVVEGLRTFVQIGRAHV